MKNTNFQIGQHDYELQIGPHKQTDCSIYEQEQDSDQIISISLTKLKGEKG
jgi:hypothetical protein